MDQQQHFEGPVAVLCLGKRLNEDGTPTKMLELRVECAAQKFLALKASGVDVWLIVTGGEVQKGVGTEAALMKTLAMKHGVPSGHVILEPQAKTTVENMSYSKKILEQKKFTFTFLVTSEFHMDRSLLIFKNSIPQMQVAPCPHDSRLTTEELNAERMVEREMLFKYRQRFPKWDFSSVDAQEKGPI